MFQTFLIPFAVLVVLYSQSAIAAQSGFIQNGKVNIVYKDGEKVGEYPPQNSERRKPNDVSKGTSINGITLYFEEDDLARCYFMTQTQQGLGAGVRNPPMNCVKLNEVRK